MAVDDGAGWHGEGEQFSPEWIEVVWFVRGFEGCEIEAVGVEFGDCACC